MTVVVKCDIVNSGLVDNVTDSNGFIHTIDEKDLKGFKSMKKQYCNKKQWMKKAAVLSVAGLMAMTAFTGCGKKEGKNASARKVVEYNVNDYVTLGQYTGMDVEEKVTPVTDEDVQKSIDSLIQSKTTYEDVTDRGAQQDDKVMIDYTRSSEGQEDVTQNDFELTIGNESLGEEFDEKLKGLQKDANLTFTLQETKLDDETQESKEISATYNVIVKNIQKPVVPELTDQFIKDNSDYETIDEYKQETKKSMEESNRESAKNQVKSELLEKAVDNATVSGCPAFVYNINYNSMMQNYTQYASYFGVDLDTYLGYMGKNKEDMKTDAVTTTKQTLVIEALLKDAGADITDDKFNEKLDEYVEKYDQFNSRSDVLKALSHEELLYDMRREAAIEYLYNNNNVKQVTSSES